MKLCRWPRGCMQWSDQDVCGYHRKMAAGLFETDVDRFRSRAGVSPASVVSDEQLQLVDVLRALGAGPVEISRALTRAG